MSLILNLDNNSNLDKTGITIPLNSYQAVLFNKTASGSQIIDESTNGSPREEQPGKYWLCDGSDDTIDTDVSANIFNTGGDGSYSAWFKIDYSLGTSQTLFHAREDGNEYFFARVLSNIITCRYRVGGTNKNAIFDFTDTDMSIDGENDNLWTHIVFTYSSADGEVFLYVNGVKYSQTGSGGMGGSKAGFQVGLGSLAGGIRDVRVYTKGLTENEVKYLTTCGDIGDDPTVDDCVLWWKCEGQHATIAYDSSGNGNNGTKDSITTEIFHAEELAVPYSFENEVGFSDGGIPRDESNTTLDATGAALDYSGRVPRNVNLINSNCGTFDGSDDRIRFNNDTLCSSDSDFSISIDFKINSLSGSNHKCLIFRRETSTNRVNVFYNYIDANLVISIHDGGWTTKTIPFSDTSNNHTLAFSWDSILGVINGFLDGVEMTGTTSANLAGSNGYKLSVGHASYDLEWSAWNFRVWDSKLTDSDIENLSNNLDVSSSPDLHWPLAEGGGVAAYDVSGNSNDGEILDSTSATFWGATQDDYHFNFINGFEHYDDDATGLDIIRVPYLPLFSKITPTISGYTKNQINNAGYWNNNAETELDFTGGEPKQPWLNRLYKGYASFNGSSSYINIPHTLDASSSYEIRCSFNTSISTSNVIIDGRGNENQGAGIIINPNGTITLRHGDSSSSVTNTQTTNSYDDGLWHDIVASWDGSTVSLTVDDETVTGSNSTLISNGGGIRIGARSYTSTALFFDGYIKDVTITEDGIIIYQSLLIDNALDITDQNNHGKVKGATFPKETIETAYSFGDERTAPNYLTGVRERNFYSLKNPTNFITDGVTLLTAHPNYNSVSFTLSNIDSSDDIELLHSGVPLHPLVPNDIIPNKHWSMAWFEDPVTLTVTASGQSVTTSTLTYTEPVTTTTINVPADMPLPSALAQAENNDDIKIILASGTYNTTGSSEYQATFNKRSNIVIKGDDNGFVKITAEVDSSSYTYPLASGTVYEVSGASSDIMQCFFDDAVTGQVQRLAQTEGAGLSDQPGEVTNWTLSTLDANPLGGWFHDSGSLYIKLPSGINPSGLMHYSDQTTPRCFYFSDCNNIHVSGVVFEHFTDDTYPASQASAIRVLNSEDVYVGSCKFNHLDFYNVECVGCKRVLIENNESFDGQDYLTYVQVRKSGTNRKSGTTIFSDCTTVTCKDNLYDNFLGIVVNGSFNVNIFDNTFLENRNLVVDVHLHGNLLSVVRNTMTRCGNPVPGNEGYSTTAPAYWIGNVATEAGWDGSADVLAQGDISDDSTNYSSRTSKGNRIGGSNATEYEIGQMFVYNNSIEVIAEFVDTGKITGLDIDGRKQGKHRFINNLWEVYKGGWDGSLSVFDADNGDGFYAYNLDQMTFSNNQFWTDYVGDSPFSSNGRKTFAEMNTEFNSVAGKDFDSTGVFQDPSISTISGVDIYGITNSNFFAGSGLVGYE